MKYATIKDLQTFYGSEDLMDFVEIIAVDNHNANIAREQS